MRVTTLTPLQIVRRLLDRRQIEVARWARLDAGKLSKIEHGFIEPSADELRRIIAALGPGSAELMPLAHKIADLLLDIAARDLDLS